MSRRAPASTAIRPRPIPHTYLGTTRRRGRRRPRYRAPHRSLRHRPGGRPPYGHTAGDARPGACSVPPMHTEMWEQPSVQENLATLRRRGVMVLEPDVRSAWPGVTRGRGGSRARSDRRTCRPNRGRLSRGPQRPARPSERRRHPRGHRPGPRDIQSLVGTTGRTLWPR